MLIFGFIIFIIILMILLVLKISTKDGIYKREFNSFETHRISKGHLLNFESRNNSETPLQIQVGPLKYKITNPSTLTYKHVGYMGNTGNQLFEIAATLGIAYRNKCRVVFPSSLKELAIYQMFDLSHLPIEDVVCDDNILEFDNYEEINIPNDGRIYNLEGYRQCYMYFECIRDYLKELFPLRNNYALDPNYIAVHIRRTDTVNNSYLHKILQLQLNCSFDYYRLAIERIRKENNLINIPVIVITDDVEWVKNHLTEIDENAKLVPGNKYSDFHTMYHAKYLIISNSTFSIWAAFLGRHKQVIAPGYWWPNGLPSQLTQINYQPICDPNWSFNDPITGEIINQSYHWGPEYWSTKNWFNRTLRAMFGMNMFRKKT